MDTTLWVTIIIVMVQAFGTVIVGFLFWQLKNLIRDIKSLEHEKAERIAVERLQQQMDKIPREYVFTERFEGVMKRVFDKLDQIEDKLDGKENVKRN